MKTMPEKLLISDSDVFISYRRKGADVLAKLLYETLRSKKYSVFYDFESLSSGEFLEAILAAVRRAKDVIVILTKDCLARCCDEKDTMFREICEAIEYNKKITLIFTEDFETPSEQELAKYPEQIEKLLKYQGYRINIEHYDNTLNKICDGFASKPIAYTEDDVHQAVSYLLKSGMVKLGEDEKNGLVDGVLSASYGTKIASAVSAFLRTNPRYYNNIRLKFNYEISIDNVFPFGKVAIDKQKYFKLSESLSYQKHFIDSAPGREFWISFARNLDELDESLRDEEYIFSENLLIDESDLQTIISLPEADQKLFFAKQMRVRFNLNGEALDPVALIINKAGIFAKYETAREDTNNPTILDVRIKFDLPHRKVSSYFFASISDPTYSPYISFSYPEDDVNVEMISFMNRNITTANTKVFEGERAVSLENEWVLPMSGIIFIMTPTEQ